MATQTKRDQIKKHLEEYFKLKSDVLSFHSANTIEYPKYTHEEIDIIVNETNRLLKLIKEKPEVLESVNFSFINSIESNLKALTAQLAQIQNLTKSN